MTTLSKTVIPPSIWADLEPIKDDDKAVKEYGIKFAIDMCNRLKKCGVSGFHFYTLNLEKSVRLILEGLEFVAPIDQVKPLPWPSSLAKNRTKETVRPIFWRNRPRSYILRTEAWDEFPNGRWGDSRSPAYGELDGYGLSLKYSKADCLEVLKGGFLILNRHGKHRRLSSKYVIYSADTSREILNSFHGQRSHLLSRLA
jgi:methylenetetrahydrofolate reductase (NADPH)